MPDIAKLIEVTGAPGTYTICIDGLELPWYVLDGVTAISKRGELSALTISIPADRIVFAERKSEADWMLVQVGSGEEIERWSTSEEVHKWDIVTASDGRCWRIERVDLESKMLHVSSDVPASNALGRSS